MKSRLYMRVHFTNKEVQEALIAYGQANGKLPTEMPKDAADNNIHGFRMTRSGAGRIGFELMVPIGEEDDK